MSEAPRVTAVVLPGTHPDAPRRSLQDALAQRGVALDVLVPDGLGAAPDARVRRLPDGVGSHPAAVLAAALGAGCAPWVALLAAGDRWHPDHVRCGLEAAEAAGADWAYGSRVLLDASGEVTGIALADRPRHLASVLRHRNAVGGPSSVLCRTAILEEDRPFDPELRALTHWAAWMVLARRPAAACPEPLVAERPGAVLSVREPGAAWRELERLRRDGRLTAPDLLHAARAIRKAPARRARHAPPRWLAPPSAIARAASGGEGPEVSVIVPTRNRPAFVRQAIASALAQDVALEVLVIDDASDHPDALAALDFADPRVRVLRRAEPGGAGRARNDALGVARGEWLAFLDDDDLMAPGRLATHLQHVGDAGFSFCGQVLVDPARHVVGVLPAPKPDDLAARLRVGSLIGGPSAVVVRTELARDAGGFREDLYALGDWDLWMALAARARAVALPELLVAYTVHPSNMHLRAPERILEDFRRFDALHGVGAPAEEALLAWLAEDLAAHGRHRAAAAMHVRLARLRRRPGDAAPALRAALRRDAAAAPAPDLEPCRWLAAYGDAGGGP
jgi:hypothetical protein